MSGLYFLVFLADIGYTFILLVPQIAYANSESKIKRERKNAKRRHKESEITKKKEDTIAELKIHQ